MVTDTRDLEAFRLEARHWLKANAPFVSQGEKGSVAVFHDGYSAEEADRLAAAIDWQRAKLANGWGAINLPTEYGGLGRSDEYAMVFSEEEGAIRVPSMPEVVGVTVRLAAPTISIWGSGKQKDDFVRRFLNIDALCCQLFSEPDAGSDLAAVKCRAVRSESGWHVDGQKVWTSGAHLAEFGILLARTDTSGAKHAGITTFIVPMADPGIEVRPIRQMTGGSAFNEVFISGVHLDHAAQLGPEGSGWKVALTMLGFERLVAGSAMQGIGGSVGQVIALARNHGKSQDPVIRQELSRLYASSILRELTMERLRWSSAMGGLEGSLGKLLWTKELQEIGSIATRILGAAVTADTRAPCTYAWTEHLLGAPGYRIAGGSDEIQRNIIAERSLGLPPEPKVATEV